MKSTLYAPPVCEYEYYLEAASLLTGSDLTDDGAGDSLIPGSEFTF